MKTGAIPKMGRDPQIPASSRGVPRIHQNLGGSRTPRLSTRRKSILDPFSGGEVKKMNMTKRIAEEPLPIPMFLGGGGDSSDDDDDGCDHSDHSAESDADSSDTDAGE